MYDPKQCKTNVRAELIYYLLRCCQELIYIYTNKTLHIYTNTCTQAINTHTHTQPDLHVLAWKISSAEIMLLYNKERNEEISRGAH